MKYSTYIELASLPTKPTKPLPTMNHIIQDIEYILDYEFEDTLLCRHALIGGQNQRRLAGLPCVPNLGDEEGIAAAARQCGIDGFFQGTRNGQTVSDEQLATTVKALLGAIYEDSSSENDVLRAAYSLGLEPVEEDLLGVEEFKFVMCVCSVPGDESLL